MRLGGEKNLAIVENNIISGTGNGIQLRDRVNAIVRSNVMENCYYEAGMKLYGGDFLARAYDNEVTNCVTGVLVQDIGIIDLGGGNLDVHRWSYLYGLTEEEHPGTAVVPSCGRNTLQGSTGYDVQNNNTQNETIMAENNIWDHTTVQDVEAFDVDGLVDVNPLY